MEAQIQLSYNSNFFQPMYYINIPIFEKLKSDENIGNLSDEELVVLYRESDEKEYLGILFKRYSHLVFGVCMKYLKDEDESKDAAMQVFEKLFVELKRHEIQHFRAWLHTVTKYHCLMILRSGSKEISGIDPYIMENEAAKHPLHAVNEESGEKEKQLQDMESALLHLEPHQQQCIKLFYLEEKSYQQVASITGFTMNQVKSYIQNGKRNLKMIMSRNE
jgi:RNA polymerase sigma factor (sigma-70 family)